MKKALPWSLPACAIFAISSTKQETAMSIFHLALTVADLEETRKFYGEVLGCQEGRSTETWVDFDFFGHQLSLHKGDIVPTTDCGQVGGIQVPIPHMGVILPQARWQMLADRLTEQGIAFVLAPSTRFAGEPGEQSTMFFRDPSGNALEIKGFADMGGVFAQ
jgi:extradiol dioxygenase family protein